MTGQRITSPDIDEALSTLRGALRRMHRLKGAPSYREIQRTTGRQTSHATVGDILRCLRKPSYDHLDRLATRMRRTNEGLLVIADSASGWERRDPATLPEIVQSATAQIENDSRVGYDDLNPDLVIDPKAVTDLVHLLAELLDNAVT